MTDKDELFKGIDEAANSLFEQYIVKKPETIPAAIPKPEPELELDLELETVNKSEPETPKPSPKPEAPRKTEKETAPESQKTSGTNQLFSELEESLLTIDWEVNEENILKTRDILSKLVKTQGWANTTPTAQVTDRMDKVLALMLKSPENSPVSAPSQLKKALQAIKDSSSPGGATDENLTTILTNLQDLLSTEASDFGSQQISNDLQAGTPVELIPAADEEPSFDLGLEMSSSSKDDQSSAQGEAVPTSTTDVLKSFTAGIAEVVKLLTPMDNLFASRPAMAKLHAATKRLKEKLLEQQKLFGDTFSSDYSEYHGLGTLNSWLESQLDVIKGNASRIGKMERLFGKAAGYEKLHTRSKKIRKSLEKQLDAITIAVGGTPTQHQFDLTGEYPAVIQPATPKTPEAPAAVVSAVSTPEAMVDKCITLARSIEQGSSDAPQDIGNRIIKHLQKLKAALSGAAIRSPGASAAASSAAAIAGHSTKCRWDWLLKTSWGGQLVGIAPEQVVYESKSTFPLSSFKDLTFFNLKKLKSMPWKSLQGLFSGELAELDNSTLNDMELEIATPPTSFPGSTKKKVYLIILYTGGKGKIFLVDAPTEAISVAEEALWSPGTVQESDIAGTLTVYGSTIPVVSID